VASGDAELVDIDGQEVRLSSPGKILFGERGETKRDLVDYYLRVGEPLLRTMGGRPVIGCGPRPLRPSTAPRRVPS
jgi:hypothetical protein